MSPKSDEVDGKANVKPLPAKESPAQASNPRRTSAFWTKLEAACRPDARDKQEDIPPGDNKRK